MSDNRIQKKQVWLLTIWSLAFLLPLYWIKGANCVTITYWEAADRFWQGLNPYAAPIRSDVFHYSPFFAFVYYPLTLLPGFLHASLWGLINIFVFWKGMSLWFRLHWKQPAIVLFALICSAMELDISMRYQQCNAMMAGFILMSLYHLKEKSHWRTGLFYALAVNFKIFPVAFGLPLIKSKKALISAGGVLLLLAILPAIHVGLRKDLELHKQQVKSIQDDTVKRKMSDLRPTFERRGFPEFGKIAHYTVLLFFFLYSIRFVILKNEIFLELYYSLTAVTLLLISPRTESPTFILLAPAYVFLAKNVSKWLYPPLLFSMFIITFVYTEVWNPLFHLEIQNEFFSKTLGALILWGICALELLSREIQVKSSLNRLNSETLPA